MEFVLIEENFFVTDYIPADETFFIRNLNVSMARLPSFYFKNIWLSNPFNMNNSIAYLEAEPRNVSILSTYNYSPLLVKNVIFPIDKCANMVFFLLPNIYFGPDVPRKGKFLYSLSYKAYGFEFTDD